MRKIIITCLLISPFLKSNAQGNNFKLNLAPLVWGEIRLGYERVTNENQALQINFGYMSERKLPSSIYDISEVEDYGQTVDLQDQVSGFSLSGEYRFYTSSSKESPRGFYIAPYLKYNKYNAKTSVTFNYAATAAEYLELTPEQQAAAVAVASNYYDLDVTGTFDASLRQLGVGVMMGYQWLIADHISIDINFFGIGIDSYSFTSKLSSDNILVDYTRWGEEIKKEIADMEYIGDKVDVTVEDDNVKMDAPLILPNFRASLSIGVAF